MSASISSGEDLRGISLPLPGPERPPRRFDRERGPLSSSDWIPAAVASALSPSDVQAFGERVRSHLLCHQLEEARALLPKCGGDAEELRKTTELLAQFRPRTTRGDTLEQSLLPGTYIVSLIEIGGRDRVISLQPELRTEVWEHRFFPETEGHKAEEQLRLVGYLNAKEIRGSITAALSQLHFDDARHMLASLSDCSYKRLCLAEISLLEQFTLAPNDLPARESYVSAAHYYRVRDPQLRGRTMLLLPCERGLFYRPGLTQAEADHLGAILDLYRQRSQGQCCSIS